MLLMLFIVISGSLLLGWVQNRLRRSALWTATHVPARRICGHETGNVPSHFIALNLQGQIDIIELPGGDATHARMYVGPRIYGTGADLVSVTLRFIDPAHTHHPEMLILFQNTQIVFANVQGTFRPATP